MGCSGSKTPPRTTQVIAPKHKEEPDAEETNPAPSHQHFKVELERRLTDGEDEALGATFIHHDEGKTLLVASIMQEGLFPRWNLANETTPENQVKMGDVILMVNGMIGNCDLMVPETAKKSMVLIVQRGGRTARGSLVLMEPPIAPPPAVEPPSVEPPSPEKKFFEVAEDKMSNKSTDIGDVSPSTNGSLASGKPAPLPPPPLPPPPPIAEPMSPEPKAVTKETLVMNLEGDGNRELQLEADECNDGAKAVYCKGYMCMF